MPPSERLLAAVEAFYSLPSRERPRDRYAISSHTIECHVFICHERLPADTFSPAVYNIGLLILSLFLEKWIKIIERCDK